MMSHSAHGNATRAILKYLEVAASDVPWPVVPRALQGQRARCQSRAASMKGVTALGNLIHDIKRYKEDVADDVTLA